MVLLGLLSSLVIASLFRLLYRISHHKHFSLSVLTVLLFPGTIIHELSHLFVAEILGVRTGKLTLIPEGLDEREELEGGEIRAGSVAVAKTDPFRRSAIGVAPVVAGIGVLTALSYLLQTNNTNAITIIIYYIMFAVSNSMFSSREDMKGVVPLLLTLALFAAAAYAAGLRIGLTGQALVVAGNIVSSLVSSLGMVLAVNGVILIALKLLSLAITKVIV